MFKYLLFIYLTYDNKIRFFISKSYPINFHRSATRSLSLYFSIHAIEFFHCARISSNNGDEGIANIVNQRLLEGLSIYFFYHSSFLGIRFKKFRYIYYLVELELEHGFKRKKYPFRKSLSHE